MTCTHGKSWLTVVLILQQLIEFIQLDPCLVEPVFLGLLDRGDEALAGEAGDEVALVEHVAALQQAWAYGDSLHTPKVGVQRATAYESWARQAWPKAEIVIYATGSKPNTDALKGGPLAAALDETGHIKARGGGTLGGMR